MKTQNDCRTTHVLPRPAKQTASMNAWNIVRRLLLLGILLVFATCVPVGAQSVETVTMDYKFQDYVETSTTVAPGKIKSSGYVNAAQIDEWMLQIRASNGQESDGLSATGRAKDGITGETITYKALALNYRASDGTLRFFRWMEHSRAYGAKLCEESWGLSDAKGFEGELRFRGGTGRYSGATGSGVVSSTRGIFGTITLLRPPPPLLSIRRDPDGVTMSWDKSVSSYILIGSADLSGEVWRALSGVVDNSVTIQETVPSRFYKLVW
jgi:hypothetical protein